MKKNATFSFLTKTTNGYKRVTINAENKNEYLKRLVNCERLPIFEDIRDLVENGETFLPVGDELIDETPQKANHANS